MAAREPAMIVQPLEAPPHAVVRVPGSKSLTNRALVCAALADGTSMLEGALSADDTEAMIECLRRLGVSIEVDAAAAVVTVTGCGGRFPVREASLDVRQSGTTARFLLPVLALGEGRYVLDADAQMRARPMADLVAAVRSLGGEVIEHAGAGRLPLTVVAGGLRGGDVEVRGDITSQFLSGLLLAGPVTDTGIRVRLTSELVSRPYVEMTRAVMGSFGVEAGADLSVRPQRYRATRYVVEPDASAASYFFAAAAMTGGCVRVEGLGAHSLQGDLRFVELLAAMGAEVDQDDHSTTVRGTGLLAGIDADLRELSDTVPTLAVVAALASGPTRISGIGFIRNKESDRIGAVVAELRRCGIDAIEEADGFVVRPGRPHGASVRTYDDHRLAMAFALLGLVVEGIDIDRPECVAKTFPRYWSVLDALRGGSSS